MFCVLSYSGTWRLSLPLQQFVAHLGPLIIFILYFIQFLRKIRNSQKNFLLLQYEKRHLLKNSNFFAPTAVFFRAFYTYLSAAIIVFPIWRNFAIISNYLFFYCLVWKRCYGDLNCIAPFLEQFKPISVIL